MAERSHDHEQRLAEQALVGGLPHRVGWFRYYFDDHRWEWSPEVQRMYGYEPGTVVPTTALLLSHKHPEDSDRITATIEDLCRTRQPFSARYRIRDAHGNERHLMVIADLIADASDEVVGTYGFCVDVTPAVSEQQQAISAAVAEIAEHRAVIEQVKGMLIHDFGVTEDQAFAILVRLSQETNTKLRHIATQLRDDLAGKVTIDTSRATLEVLQGLPDQLPNDPSDPDK
jgi:PAS domain S-box-containing protein